MQFSHVLPINHKSLLFINRFHRGREVMNFIKIQSNGAHIGAVLING